MKKHILPALIMGALIGMAPAQQATAQIHNDRGTFNMPGKGSTLIETQATVGFNGNIFSLNDNFLSSLNNGLDIGLAGYSSENYFPMLKMRKFVSNDMVMRCMVNVSYNSQKITDTISSDFKVNNLGLALGLGIEKIYTPAERLNTYIGADITVGFARLGAKATNVDTRQNAFGFGIKGFTGMDYYVLPKVYLGLELGWGLSYNHYGEIQYENGDNGQTSSSFTLTPYVTPTFRLGFVLCDGKKMHGNGEPTYRSNESSNDED